MTGRIPWLRGEIERWVASDLVAPEQAEALRALYPEPSTRSWPVLVFGGLGAAITGLGVILLFAYNWEAMHRGVKLALVFGAIGGVHGAGLWLRGRGESRRAAGETLSLLGTMLFGAGIWLVAQIYHIDEHYPDAVLAWGAGALALAWALPSSLHGLLACVLLAVWGGLEAIEFHSARFIAPAAIALLVAPLAWRERSRVLAALVVPAFVLAIGFDVGAVTRDETVYLALLSSVVALRALAAFLARRERFPAAGPIVAFWGTGGYVALLFPLTFPYVIGEVFGFGPARIRWEPVLWWGPPAVALAAWLALAASHLAAGPRRGEKGLLADLPWDVALMPVALALVALSHLVARGLGEWTDWGLAGAFNAILLAWAIARMVRGTRAGEVLPTFLGSAVCIALVLVRFQDLFENLAGRGVVFVVVGGCFLAQGLLLARVRRAGREGGAS